MRPAHHRVLILTCLLVTAPLLFSGCATIASGTNQNVSFDSEPQGATVRVDGQLVGTTPVSSRLDKKGDQTVSFALPGYRTVSKDLATKTDPWFFGNIITGGLFGSTTDFASGAVYEYSPNQYFVTLPPNNNGGMLDDRQQTERFIVASYTELRAAAATQRPETDRTFANLLGALRIDASNRQKVDAVAQVLMDNQRPVNGANAITDRF